METRLNPGDVAGFVDWKEESQHAVLDELEWMREDGKLAPAERDRALDDSIALVATVDELLRLQAAPEVTYFTLVCAAPSRDLQVQGANFYADKETS